MSDVTTATAAPTSLATSAPTQAQGTATATQTQSTNSAPIQPQQTDTSKAQANEANYSFKAPEGITYDEKVVDAYSKAAKELNLPQDAAQKLLNDVYGTFHQQQLNLRSQWADEVRSDPVLGGAQLDANIAVARKAIEAFGTPELVELLNVTGLGNNKHVISAFYRAGQAISTDRFVAGGNSSGKGQLRGTSDIARALYPNQGQ